VTITNPNRVPVTLKRLQVCLPKGFQFVVGSVTGDLTSNPTTGRCGAGRKAMQLTWRAARVSASSKLRFRFTVRAGRLGGTLVGSVNGTADGGFAVTPASARIKVLPSPAR
jgi:hypothetical protein